MSIMTTTLLPRLAPGRARITANDRERKPSVAELLGPAAIAGAALAGARLLNLVASALG